MKRVMLGNMVFKMKELDNILLLGTSNSMNYVCTESSLYHMLTFKFFHTMNEMGNIHKNRQSVRVAQIVMNI